MAYTINPQSYYNLFCAIQEIPRYTIKQLCPLLNYGGRGQKYSTVNDHITKLYEKKISLFPNLVLRTFENCYTKGYFLRVKDPVNISSVFYELQQNQNLSYMLLLSGTYDFYVTSKLDLNFGKNVRIEKKSVSYTPIYTNPLGWNHEFRDILPRIVNSSLREGKIEREMEDWLPWEEIHFHIYEMMKNNVQIPFSRIADVLGVSSNTVKKYFYQIILPYCNISHYFFPKGYDYYQKAFLIMETDYEKGLLDVFTKLPCTTYIFPMEKEIASVVFHEGIQDLMLILKKFEEKGFIKKHLLLVPLHWD
jgi:hypothetical protein